eukprot:11155587-Lingulodinium_polyedra.AAC.1
MPARSWSWRTSSLPRQLLLYRRELVPSYGCHLVQRPAGAYSDYFLPGQRGGARRPAGGVAILCPAP